MSKGDINAFLKKLFDSEGGKNPKIINKYGYIGKYQFGEDALIDLGYYKRDGTKNRNAAGKFEYDWVGEWTGKNGVHSRDDFLNSESAQDTAAKEWIQLLCKRLKHYKLQSYLNQSIDGIQITESGIIAAAHLKGYGDAKNPGVSHYLNSNGAINPTDANGTPVSRYMEKFANYDLGCCGSLTAVFVDKDKIPIAGVGYQIKSGEKILAKGKTDKNGATRKVEGLSSNTSISILIRKLEGGVKEIKSFLLKEEAAIVATVRSATRMVTTQLEKHIGETGNYKRHSEVQPKVGQPAAPSTQQMRSNSPDKTSTIQKKFEKQRAAEIPQKSSESQIPASSSSQTPTSVETTHDSKTDESGSDNETQASLSVDANFEMTVAESVVEGSLGEGPNESEIPVVAEIMRNDAGHPIAVIEPARPILPINPSIQKLEEILMKNVNYGKKAEALSGPVAAQLIKQGKPISVHTKPPGDSLGRCYKYVKIALLASGMANRYLGEEAAQHAGAELQKVGYRNLLGLDNHGLASPYDAPLGAMIVYAPTDNSPSGHIEVRVSNGFASDYFSERPRTSTKSETREHVTMEGRKRKVTGIWIKN